eukprot:633467-Pelagomonas_calceolata.AAC.3
MDHHLLVDCKRKLQGKRNTAYPPHGSPHVSRSARTSLHSSCSRALEWPPAWAVAAPMSSNLGRQHTWFGHFNLTLRMLALFRAGITVEKGATRRLKGNMQPRVQAYACMPELESNAWEI